jgi:hypothetical protein
VLHYRLYDIDVVINRTLVYGLLTAILVAVYFGGIVVLQRLFVVLTGETSTLAVVASTLSAVLRPIEGIQCEHLSRILDPNLTLTRAQCPAIVGNA